MLLLVSGVRVLLVRFYSVEDGFQFWSVISLGATILIEGVFVSFQLSSILPTHQFGTTSSVLAKFHDSPCLGGSGAQ